MKMTRYSPLTAHDSLKGFLSSRPPLIISVILLGLLALILMTLAFCVQHSQLNRPDISQDWNLFLESFEKLDFCIDNGTMGANTFTANTHMGSISGHDMSTMPVSVTPVELDAANIQTISQTAYTSTSSRNYSIQMMLEVKPTFEFISIPHNLTYLSGSILGSELGLKGSAGEEWISMAVQLPFEWNTTRCESLFSRASCDTVHIYTCVHLHASELVFPTTRSPQRCEILNDTGVEYHALMKTYKQKLYSSSSCRGRTVVHARYKLDPRLTVLLSLSDRSVINLHLLHSSYFVFVMTITILLYVIVRGLPIRFKSAHQLSPGGHV